MRMCPLFSDTGQLLGHVNLDRCAVSRDRIIVDNSPQHFCVDRIDEKTTVNIVNLPMWTIVFRDGDIESKNRYAVSNAKLPAWFWDSPGAVKFSPGHWSQ